jgi:hypothetical protein
MTYMLCRNKVVNYSTWKRVFDSHAAAQFEAGLSVEKVLRNLDDPSEVFMLFRVTDLEKARAFVCSPEVPDAQEQSGVVDDPDIYFFS